MCNWLVTLPVASIHPGDLGGIVLFAQMARVLEIVRSLESDSATPPSETEAES